MAGGWPTFQDGFDLPGCRSFVRRGGKGRRACFFISNQFVSDETQEKPKPRPFKTERVGHPKRLDRSLGVDVLEWYDSNVRVRQLKETRKGGPPATARWSNHVRNEQGHRS